MLRLYTDLAGWYTRLTASEDYVEEAAFYARLIDEAAAAPVRTVLELGAGAGATWLEVLEQAGFEARCLPLEHSGTEPERHHLFVCTLKPRAPSAT